MRAVCNEAAGAAHRCRGSQRGLRREHAGARRRRPRPHRARRHRRRRRHVAGARRARRARSARRSRPTLRTEHGVTLGHWPQSIDLSTVGGWLACRSAGQLSTRYGKIEDMVLGPRRRARRRSHAAHRRRTPSRGGARPHPGVRRQRGHARDHHRRAAARAPRSRRRGARRVPLRRRSPTGSTRAAASCGEARRPRCCASTTPSRATATSAPATRNMLLVLDEGDPALLDARAAVSCTRSAHDAADRRSRARSTRGSSTATTSPRSTRTSSRARSSTPWRSRHAGRRSPTCTTACSPRSRAVARPRGGVGAPLARVPRRRVPLLHLRRLPAERAA